MDGIDRPRGLRGVAGLVPGGEAGRSSGLGEDALLLDLRAERDEPEWAELQIALILGPDTVAHELVLAPICQGSVPKWQPPKTSSYARSDRVAETRTEWRRARRR